MSQTKKPFDYFSGSALRGRALFERGPFPKQELSVSGPETAMVEEPGLLSRFTDDGDTLLGTALGTEEGRSLYNGIRNYFITGIDPQRIFNHFCYGASTKYGHTLSADQRKVLVLKMMSKAMGDFIQEKLLA
ncbi:MAG: hypothetical protein A3B86_03765 [Candidatus Yanofskybacteria bacterium RIFCSPHIGHO2_02_FULL_38_22b]|uniref:Uncharacterized protein n=1 Tax=Candidatus Yanofskybacteria bacterium RIFCSPHIGHO2_02_FULL_38_22b TaxID=1802673 RepID=A0A1F8F1P8_9BACT|nr:MAG: hypothetical protein A2816_01530 [Candidatus Yanofskybacteria bacterium RIFCSPHIGHO2_01_FULL_39_44]OGN06209.1 MAG: hypothetical protein A3B86_03765 [Candidatus Yanofskybacteria bacterium RIFCSPHIGHO2_02_FULL_38_22b]OGN19628.1 MAG: hypothetical protein A2910_03495 [Candidatus Yanofskybacteria bacterium RIFCSPLOWO2_01_FULL_39_28]